VHFDAAAFHADVELVNARLIHSLPFDDVRARLPDGATTADWELIRPNLLRVADYPLWEAVLHGEVEAPPAPQVYQGTHLLADFDAVSISVDGEAVRLTRREFELLRYLVQNKSRVVSRDRLLERVWGYDRLVETRSVDVHVGRLRSKLGPAGQQIETVVGLGYRFID